MQTKLTQNANWLKMDTTDTLKMVQTELNYLLSLTLSPKKLGGSHLMPFSGTKREGGGGGHKRSSCDIGKCVQTQGARTPSGSGILHILL